MSRQNYSVECKSRKQLRFLAEKVREILDLSDRVMFPIVGLLDIFSKTFDNFSYEIVEDDQLPDDIHAETDIMSGHVTIKQSVYDGACEGNGRDRMTIAHEICHYITRCTLGFRVQRNFGKEIRPCEDPEWHAKCMAGELMISKRLTKNMDPLEIAEACGVSFDAARYQYGIFRSEEE